MADPLSLPPAHGNGYAPEQSLDVSHIKQALEAVYSPQSSNETRQAASSFLEDAKRHAQAPTYGYELARERTNPPILRHYGLSMLEYCVKYTWETYSEEQAGELRMSVVQLAFDAAEEDPQYLRNKVAQLWLETAKRCWGLTWTDMDELLVKLWHRSPIHQHIVLTVLETLSEDMFKSDDLSFAARDVDLGTACSEIFTPAAILQELYPNRKWPLNLRYGDEGWLQRVSVLLQNLLAEPSSLTEQTRSIAMRCVNTMRQSLSWVVYRAVLVTNAVGALQLALLRGDLALQIAAIDALNTLYIRKPHHDEEDAVAVLDLIVTTEWSQLLRQLYEYSKTEADNIDDTKYSLHQKVTEFLNAVGLIFEQRSAIIPARLDGEAFVSLLFDVMHSPSLLVSIPILSLWTKFLRSRVLREAPWTLTYIGGLLEICSRRLVRYEYFPEDSDDPTYQFLLEDFETIPERHSFVGNYRRLCNEVIEVIVRRFPVDATTHILEQAVNIFQEVADGQQNFRPETFERNSQAFLKLDAHATVIEAAVKGYMKWLTHQTDDAQTYEADRNRLQGLFEECSAHMMALDFRDPDIQRRVLSLLVYLAARPLRKQTSFASRLLEHMFKPPPSTSTEGSLFYGEAVKSLRLAIASELQRLGMACPDHYLPMFDELERRISELLATTATDEKQELGYQTFLFTIVHRSTGIDPTIQMDRLQQMLQPVRAAWQETNLTKSLGSFESFCELMGLSRLPEFITRKQLQRFQDWSEVPLDEDGRSLQSAAISRCSELPLRLTKAFLAASTEKLEPGTPQMEIAYKLWTDLVPLMLPHLLQLINYAQAFNSAQSWSSLPEEVPQVIQRMLTDRLWQNGISKESRDDFFARVSNSKDTYDGLASSVRGCVRQVRETGYWILYGLVRFRELFFGNPDLATPLSHALYSNADSLSAHHWTGLLNLSVQLLEGCPPPLRQQFLPPVLSAMFLQVDKKLCTEWDAVLSRGEQKPNGDNLGEEMKGESVLRSTTFTVTSLAFSVLSRSPSNPFNQSHLRTEGDASGAPAMIPTGLMYEVVLSNDVILQPLLIFLGNSLRFHDTRSVDMSIRALQDSIPRLPVTDAQRGPGIRRFLADDLLKAVITSLNDPYFVEYQSHLAVVIARILTISPAEGAEDLARSVLLSMPGLSSKAGKVDYVLSKFRPQPHGQSAYLGDRQQKNAVLDLLKDVRGQSIQESGRIVPAAGDHTPSKPKKQRSKLQEQYMSIDETAAAGGIGQGDEEALAGVAGMFE